MSAIPVLTYGFEEKSRFGIVNGLRRSAGVSLFLPLTLILIKYNSNQYLPPKQIGGVYGKYVHIGAPWYQQYSAAIDLIVSPIKVGGYAAIDLFIAALTFAVFGVVVWSRLRLKDEHRGRMRALVLAGAAMIVAIYNLGVPWHG
jgi:hypothetical protein